MFTQKLVLSYSTKIILQLVQMATSLVVARLVGPSVLGIIAFGSAYVSMFTIITDLGFGSAHIKLVSEGKDEATCNRTYATIKLSLTGIFVLVFLAAFYFQKFVLHKNFESETHERVIFIFLIIVTITQTFTVYTATWAARMEQAKQDVPAFLQAILYQAIRVVLAILGFKAIGLVLGNLASVLIIVPFYLYMGRDLRFGKFDKAIFKQYCNIAYPTIIYNISSTLMYYTDKVILQTFTNSKELGFYSAAYALGSFIKAIETSVGMLLFPYLSKYIAEKNYTLINSSIRKYERFTFSFILPIVFTIAIFSDLFIHITYGPKFLGTVPIFSIILITFICSLAYLPYGNILFGMGLYKLEAKIWLISLLLFWLCSYFLTSPNMLNLKGLGMSLALLISNLFIFMRYIVLTKKLNKEIILLPGKKVMFFSILFFAIVKLTIYQFPIDSYIIKTILVVVVYVIFLGTAALLKIIKEEDFLMIAELLNIAKMKKYISQEILKRDNKDKNS